MFDILLRLKAWLKNSYIHLDSPVFRFHWCFTSSFLLVCSLFIFILSSQRSIRCISSEMDTSALNDYCWAHSTYTVSNAVPQLGGDIQRKYVSYYQWVGYILLLQAILFYIPRIVWQKLEGGKLRSLVKDLDRGLEVEKIEKQKEMLDYLYDNVRTHDYWAYCYFFCELMALMNVILQIFIINKILKGVFLTFGFDVVAFLLKGSDDQLDPKLFAFPMMTKCTFHMFSGAELDKFDSLCMLPLNVINEKIFLFLWLWFFILVLLTILILICRIVTALSPDVRVFLLHRVSSLVEEETVTKVVRNTNIGDWLLLNLLSKNLDSNTFKELIDGLASKQEDVNK